MQILSLEPFKNNVKYFHKTGNKKQGFLIKHKC